MEENLNQEIIMTSTKNETILRLDSLMPVGAYKGVPLRKVIDERPTYVQWAVHHLPVRFHDEVLNYATLKTKNK